MKKKRQAVAALRAEVFRLRTEGKSFGEIAQVLGMTRQYAHKLWKQGPPTTASTEPSATASAEPPRMGPVQLAIRRARFAAALAEGKSQRLAAVAAGVPPGGADGFAQRTLKDRQFQNEFLALLARKGLTEEHLAERHMEALRATKTIVLTHDGQLRKLETPDNRARGKALELGWDLYGRRQLATSPVTNQQLAILIGLPRMTPLQFPSAKPCDEPAETDPIDVTPEEPDLDFPE